MDAEIEAEPAKRIVHVGAIAGQEHAAPAERRGDALMHVVEIAVDDWVRAALGKESLQSALYRPLVEGLLVGFFDTRGKQHAPKPTAVFAADLEQRAPFVGIGKIIARALRIFRVEGKGRRQHQESLRMGVAFERDVERLAHGRASAVRTHEIGAADLAGAVRALDRHIDAIVELLERGHAGAKIHAGMREAAQTLDRHIGELVLLALNDIGKARVVREQAEVELGDDLAGRAVPDAKLRLDQAAPDDLVDEPQLVQHFQGRRVGGGGARAVIDARFRLEHVYGDALARQRERGNDADRSAAGNQYGTLRRHRHRPAQNFSPRDLTVSAHKALSVAIMAPNSSGLLPRGSAPYWLSRATNCGSLTARAISAAILSTISFGVAAGAMSPFQVSTS